VHCTGFTRIPFDGEMVEIGVAETVLFLGENLGV
jgi:hypothetical protein